MGVNSTNTNNNILIGGCFPFLFLRGYDMLPKSTFPTSLIRHLYLYYNGRFEKTQSFTHLIFKYEEYELL